MMLSPIISSPFSNFFPSKQNRRTISSPFTKTFSVKLSEIPKLISDHLCKWVTIKILILLIIHSINIFNNIYWRLLRIMSYVPQHIHQGTTLREYIPTYTVRSDYLPTRVLEGSNPQTNDLVLSYINIVTQIRIGEKKRPSVHPETSRVQPSSLCFLSDILACWPNPLYRWTKF